MTMGSKTHYDRPSINKGVGRLKIGKLERAMIGGKRADKVLEHIYFNFFLAPGLSMSTAQDIKVDK